MIWRKTGNRHVCRGSSIAWQGAFERASMVIKLAEWLNLNAFLSSNVKLCTVEREGLRHLLSLS